MYRGVFLYKSIAKAKKPHNIGEELVKPILIDVVLLLCGENAAEKIKNVPLSDNTVDRRIDSMATDCEDQQIAVCYTVAALRVCGPRCEKNIWAPTK